MRAGRSGRRRFGVALLAGLALLGAGALVAQAEVAQKGNLRVSFSGKISPQALPRQGTAPIAVSVGGKIATADASQPPPLNSLQIAINRAGRLDYKGLPSCSLAQIQPATTANALAACGPAKVGEGSFAASVAIPEQSPFPSEGKIVAFNGAEAGKPVIFAHVYGTEPIPTSFTLPIQIAKARGTYGTLLNASLPDVGADIAFVTGISLTLNRRFQVGGVTHGYLSAGCPAPKGFPGASFPLARASFAFAGGATVSSTLVRSCKAKG